MSLLLHCEHVPQPLSSSLPNFIIDVVYSCPLDDLSIWYPLLPSNSKAESKPLLELGPFLQDVSPPELDPDNSFGFICQHLCRWHIFTCLGFWSSAKPTCCRLLQYSEGALGQCLYPWTVVQIPTTIHSYVTLVSQIFNTLFCHKNNMDELSVLNVTVVLKETGPHRTLKTQWAWKLIRQEK